MIGRDAKGVGDPMTRVLVVEDDDDLRTAVVTDLGAAGFDVDEAPDITTAAAALAGPRLRVRGVRPHAAGRGFDRVRAAAA